MQKQLENANYAVRASFRVNSILPVAPATRGLGCCFEHSLSRKLVLLERTEDGIAIKRIPSQFWALTTIGRDVG